MLVYPAGRLGLPDIPDEELHRFGGVRKENRCYDAGMPQAIPPTVLITGSTGFLGEAIARGLLDSYRVIGLDLKPPKTPIGGVHTIELD